MSDEKREVLFHTDFEAELKKGVDILADSVKITMGPKGKLVLIQREGNHPIVTKDGVTVAHAVNLSNKIQNLGVSVLKEAASRTADEAGDGTTTSTVLAQAIYTEGLKMKSAGYQVDLLNMGIHDGLRVVKKFLTSQKKEIKGFDELKQVAVISANGEEEIAELIVSAIDASGIDGSIIVEQAKGFKSDLTVVDGFRLERGFLSPYFVTDKNRMICDFENPLILLADREFSSMSDLLKPLELSLDLAKPILIIANDIDNEAMQGLVVNKTKGALRVCAVKSPGFGSSRHEMLHDIQAIVGGTVIDSSFDMSTFSEENFGMTKKSLVHKGMTMIISSESLSNNDLISKRIESIKDRLSSPELEAPEEELLRYRLQQLSGGISILRVGAATESELIERYDRVDDALHATRAAIQEGVLPGGGVSLIRAQEKLSSYLRKITNKSVDYRAGIQIISKALSEPFIQIIRNGSNSPELLLEEVKKSKGNIGYDARLEKLDDMYKTGILDPYKVVRCALENAVSASTMLLSVGCCMIDEDNQIDRKDA
jgi:chaperonin GroEL